MTVLHLFLIVVTLLMLAFTCYVGDHLVKRPDQPSLPFVGLLFLTYGMWLSVLNYGEWVIAPTLT